MKPEPAPNPLTNYHGELETLFGRTISEEQLGRFAKRWGKSGGPKWLGCDSFLKDKVLAAIAQAAQSDKQAGVNAVA